MVSAAGFHEFGVHWASRPSLALLLHGMRLTGRLTGGVARIPRLGWVISDPVLARQVLNDAEHTSLLGEGGVGHLWAQVLGDWVNDVFDGPGHAAFRARARDLFTESSATELVTAAAGQTYERAARTLLTGAGVDIAALSRVAAGRVISSLLGRSPAPDDDAAHLAVFATAERLASLALGTAGSTHLPPSTVEQARSIIEELTDGVAAGWRDGSPDTVLGRCRSLGLGLTETKGLACLMVVAGTATTASAVSRTVALLADGGHSGRLAASPGLIPAAVREGLRVTTPAPVIGRQVTGPLRVGRHQLAAGDRVLLLIWTANSAVGPLDPDRDYVPETRQLWFGAGRHLCLGRPVARAEMTELLSALAGCGRGWRVVRRRYARRVLVPTYEELIVELTDVTASPRRRAPHRGGRRPVAQ